MKVFKYKLPIIGLTMFACLLSSCGSKPGSYEDLLPENETGEYYDSSWRPGSNAVKDANQPKVKNPVGITNELYDLRKSQDRQALPSQGEANILVVPVTFKNDAQFGNAVDLVFNSSDLKQIDKIYNDGSRLYYPSVNSFYKESSFNKLSLNGVVAPVVEFNEAFIDFIARASYGSASLASLHAEVLDYVINYLFVETQTYYIGDFDSDNDRKIDCVNILYNFPPTVAIGDEYIDADIYSFLYSSEVFFHDTLREDIPVNSYIPVTELLRKAEPNGSAYHYIVSKIGLCLGLDNYADMNPHPSTGIRRAPLAYKDLIDGEVGDHNSFSKYQLGWITPKLINVDDFEESTINLDPAVDGDCVIIHKGRHSLFSEYLVVDLYTPTGLNKYDVEHHPVSPTSSFSETGIRVYKVDARLARGYGNSFVPYVGEIDLNASFTLSNGVKHNYVYDYRFTNSYVNDYHDAGIQDTTPLIALLDSFGFNRHITGASVDLYDQEYTNAMLFKQGDSFGTEDQIEGSYYNYKLNDGRLLGLTFTVSNLTDESASILIKEAN